MEDIVEELGTGVTPAVEWDDVPVQRTGDRGRSHVPHRAARPEDGAEVDLLVQLDRRLRRLERLVGGLDDDVDLKAELEAEDPELTAWARDAEYGQTLGRALVAPRVREACEQTVQAWETWQLRRQHLLETAVAASRVIATTRREQDRHRAAAGTFEAAYAELASLSARRQQLENTAAHARTQLEHDGQFRERHQREIDAGDRAWALLIERLRARTAIVTARGEPLPRWLVTALGGPPATGGSSWRELVAELLAYRLTYSVTDSAHALGDPPTSADSPRRRSWYGSLSRSLRERGFVPA